jgi:hypothetical protein
MVGRNCTTQASSRLPYRGPLLGRNLLHGLNAYHVHQWYHFDFASLVVALTLFHSVYNLAIAITFHAKISFYNLFYKLD